MIMTHHRSDKKTKEEILATLESELEIVATNEKIDRGQTNQITIDTEKDVEFSRKKIKELIQRGTEAIDDMIMIAKENEHPRSFEVLSNLLKQVSDMSSDLVSLQKTKKEITNPSKEESNNKGGTTNNAIFLGSTDELQKFLKTQNE